MTVRPKQLTKASKKQIKIGHETIYPLQQRMAVAVLSLLLANEKPDTLHKRSPLVIMQPQCGKTGVIIAIIYAFILNCIKRGRTFQVVVLCGLSHLDLTGQTRRRLTLGKDGRASMGAELDLLARQSGLQMYPFEEMNKSGIIISHNSQKLPKMDLNMDGVDVRLWVGDEVHLGNVKEGNIDILLQQHGVDICKQIPAWRKKPTVNHFVGVSATPSAHMLKSDNINLTGQALFRWIYEAPPENYNSLTLMKAKGRLKQTEPLFSEDGLATSFFEGVLVNFRQGCRKQGPGHLVIRATGTKHAHLIAYISKRGRNIECQQFDAQGNNIDELNRFLALKPEEPTIVVIRGSMRAGITLPTTHYIRGWVETESTASDAQAQAGVGRACGYDRTNDIYPIYCDLHHVDAWIDAYDRLDKGDDEIVIPSGVQNRGMGTRKRYNVKEIMEYDDAWEKYVKPYTGTESRKQISSTSGNVFNDVAGFFLEGRRDSGSTVGIRLDGPTSDVDARRFIKTFLGKGAHEKTTPEQVWAWVERNRRSYKRLLKKYPEAKGKAIIFDEGEVTIKDGQSRNALQRKTSALVGVGP